MFKFNLKSLLLLVAFLGVLFFLSKHFSFAFGYHAPQRQKVNYGPFLFVAWDKHGFFVDYENGVTTTHRRHDAPPAPMVEPETIAPTP